MKSLKKWFKGLSKSLPEPTGKVIDMLQPTWGHNLSMGEHPTEDGWWNGIIWYGNGCSVGDEIIYPAAGSVVRSIITEVRPARSVWDMYFIKAKVTHVDDNPVG